MKEKTIMVKVKDGVGEVHVGTTGYSRVFTPGDPHEVTEQEFDLYLREDKNLEVVKDTPSPKKTRR